MKLIIVVGLLIAAALSLVTNLLSNFLSKTAQKHKTLIWILFAVLIVASIIVAVWPENRSTAKIEILEVQVSTTPVRPNEGETTIAGCSQRIKLINRGNNFTSLAQYKAVARYRDSVAIATSSEIGKTAFSPDNFGNSLRELEIRLLVFTGISTMLALPTRIPPQEGIDVDVDITFVYNRQMHDVWDIHSEQMPKSVNGFTIEYLLSMADGSIVTSGPILCAYLDSKPMIFPSTPVK